MNIRALREADFEQIKQIHEKFYQHEFALPDLRHFLCYFVVEDDDGQLITAGGLRNILESILITNKDFPGPTRVSALRQALSVSRYIATSNDHHAIHAFVQDDIWKEHLIKNGFTNCKGDALILGV